MRLRGRAAEGTDTTKHGQGRLWALLLLAYWCLLAVIAVIALQSGTTLYLLPTLVAGVPLYFTAAHTIRLRSVEAVNAVLVDEDDLSEDAPEAGDGAAIIPFRQREVSTVTQTPAGAENHASSLRRVS